MVKAKIGELEDEFREVFSRRLRKYFTVLMQVVSCKSSFLVKFQDGCEKYLTSNRLTVVT